MTQQEAEAFLGQSEQSILDQPLTGEDVALALSDPNYEPTQEQFALYKEYAKNKQTDWFGALNAGIDSIINTAGKAAEQAVTSGAAINPANYAEGVLQNVRGTYEMVAQSSNPDSWAFRFKDLLFGTGTEQSQYSQFLEARKFNAQSEKYQRGEETILPKEYVNPEFAQGVALIADPTFFLPGVGEVLGAGKLSTKLIGKAAQIAGKGVTAIAKPAERALQLGERLAVEATGLTPEALRGAAVATGAAGLVGGTPALALGAAVPAAVTTARELGEAITAAGANLVTQPSRIGALEAIGRIPGASLRQRTIGIIGQYGGDLALDTALRSTAGAIEGAAIGGALGYYSGGKEGAAAGIGSGGTLGAAGAIAGRAYERLTGRAAAEARKGDFDRYVAAQDEKTAGNLLQLEADHGIDIASAYMDATELMRGMMGDVNVTLLDKKEYTDKFGKTRGVTVEAGDRPAIYVNADVFGKGRGDTPLYTLGHEMFHALEKSEQLATKASDIKDALVGSYLEEGGVSRKISEGAYNDAEILKRFENYRDKLPAAQADQLAQYDTLQKKADFIASELAAEHLGMLVAGQKPDALMRGFTGLKRELVDWALTQNSSKAISRMAEAIERTTGLKPVDSVLYPDLKQASPQVNAMLRDLMRARKRLDEAVVLADDKVTRAIKSSDMGNPVAAKTAVELGIAEKDPTTGATRWLSDDEMKVREERDTKALQDILAATPGARVVDGVIEGRFSPEQLSAVEQSQQVSGRIKDKIRAVSSAMSNGNSLWVNYGAATRRVKNRLTGKYTSKYSSGIRLSQREVLPYSFNVSKADNPYVRVMDISKMRGQLEKNIGNDGSVAGMWPSIDGFMSDLASYFTNLDRGESAKRSVELFGEDKAKFLGDFVNEGEKGGRKYVRSLRLDRMGTVEPRSFKANISEDAIQKSKLRWMPDEQVGDKTVNKSEEGFTIVRGEKVRLYDPAGKLVGIFDTQQQAENKAYATNQRIQPEVGQQEYQPRNEGGQATEAGGRNRDVGGAQGGAEGGQALGSVRQARDVTERFDTLVRSAPEVRFMPIESQPENAPVSGRLSDGQKQSIDEISAYYASQTPQRVEMLRNDAVDSLSSRLINKGIPVQEANKIALKTFQKARKGVSGALQVISGLGLSDLSRMAGTGKPTVERRAHINPNWMTSAFEAFATDEGLALMKAQQVATQLSKADQAKVAAGQDVEAAKASGVRQSSMQQGMEFVLGEMNADKKAFGSSLREDPNSPPRVYASVVEGQKFGSQGNYNVFFEWKTETPMVVTSHHHYGVANGVTGIHAQGNVGDKNARSFGNPSAEQYDTLPSGKRILNTHLLVGNAGVPDARAHQLTVSIPESSLSNVRKVYKERGASGVEAELNKIAVNQMIGSASQGKTFSYTTKEGIPPMVAIQRNRTEAYVLNPDLANVASVTIVSNSPKEVSLIKKNLEKAFQNNGTSLPKVKVVSAESGPSKNVGRKTITDEYFKLTGEVRFMPDQQGFYSKLEEVVSAKIPNSASPQQILATVDPAKGSGVKAEELKWTGFAQAVERIARENGGRVPKDKLLEHLRNEGAVRFEEVNISEKKSWTVGDYGYTEEYTTLQDALNAKENVIAYLENEIRRMWSVEKQGEDYIIVDENGYNVGTQKSDSGREIWSPEEYKAESEAEAAIKEGARAVAESNVVFYEESQGEGDYVKYQLPGGDKYREVVLTSDISKPFTSSHFNDIPNYVAHMRLNERVDSSGKPGLFVEEIQSDRHQKSRKIGYIEDKKSDWSQIPIYEYKDLVQKGIFPETVHIEHNGDIYKLVAPDGNTIDVDISLENLQRNYENRNITGVTDAPFRKDWSIQMFKRALRDAVASGKEWIGWTTGETQADRYNLRKSLSKVEVARANNDYFLINAYDKNGGEVISNKAATSETLPDILGEEFAAKIIAKPAGFHVFEGMDLELGGEGMKGFYDKILPSEVQKYVKQWGGEVKKSSIPEDQIWRVDITPKMRESIRTAGQPSFMPDASMPGAYTMTGGYRALPAKAKGKLRIYGPLGQLVGIASSLDEAQRMVQRKLR